MPFQKTNKVRFSSSDPRSIFFPRKSFLYGCLHRNWIRAYSFSNFCLSITWLILLLMKKSHPNLFPPSSPTLYSLPLNLFEQLNINFSQFHLFLISINVFEYFLRSYRYSNSYFNHQNFLLTKHTNVALILTSSLALIFGFNFVFYNNKDVYGKSFLPLITWNMILLLLINFLIFVLVVVCCLLNYLVQFHRRNLSFTDEQENLRSIVERQTCMKCYSKILENNPNLFQENNNNNSNEYEENFPFHRRIPMKFNCHRCFYLLLIFLLKYFLLTLPQNYFQMMTYSKQFYSSYVLSKNILITESFNSSVEHSWITIWHLVFLCARLGDSFLLIRYSYLMKKYFPCWCQLNSTYDREKSLSQSSIPRIQSSEHPSSTRRYRLRFQYLPLWSRNRPRLFPENQQWTSNRIHWQQAFSSFLSLCACLVRIKSIEMIVLLFSRHFHMSNGLTIRC